MTLSGDFAKALLLSSVTIWVFALLGAFITGYIGLALLLSVGFILPLSMIAYEHLKNRKQKSSLE
jgi:hypothetical protein